jgi:hypothetical protein
MMRALIVALAFALSACASHFGPPAIYPEAELAPGQILSPIRRAMGNDIVFTNATLVREGVMVVEGHRADGSYKFTVVDQDGLWVLASTERTGPAP